MRDFLIVLLVVAVVGAALCALAWFGNWFNWQQEKAYAPRMEQVRHDTFTKSQAFSEGNVSNLRSMQRQYLAADAAHQAALSSVIVDEADRIPQDVWNAQVPSDLKQFVDNLRSGAATMSAMPTAQPSPAQKQAVEYMKTHHGAAAPAH